MNINRMRIAYAGLNGVATKVFHAVPLCEAWTASQILDWLLSVLNGPAGAALQHRGDSRGGEAGHG